MSNWFWIALIEGFAIVSYLIYVRPQIRKIVDNIEVPNVVKVVSRFSEGDPEHMYTLRSHAEVLVKALSTEDYPPQTRLIAVDVYEPTLKEPNAFTSPSHKNNDPEGAKYINWDARDPAKSWTPPKPKPVALKKALPPSAPATGTDPK